MTFILCREGQEPKAPEKTDDTTLRNWDPNYFDALIHELRDILGEMGRMEAANRDGLDGISPPWRDSARNLLHYISLRQRDVRTLQTALASLGLSSLGRSEPHAMSSAMAVLDVLEKLAGSTVDSADMPGTPVDEARGNALLDVHTKALFGATPDRRSTYIMVTMPRQAADDYQIVKELLAGGTDCARINCAHGDAETWGSMIENLRRAEKELGKSCRIFMDLAGHRLRTGPIRNLAVAARWSPKHDAMGKTIAPARIWLTPVEHKTPPASPMDACLPLPAKWLARLAEGDDIDFTDTRGRGRTLAIVSVAGDCRIAECSKGAYVANGTRLAHRPRGPNALAAGEAEVSELPSGEQYILVSRGDTLILTKDQAHGRPPVYDDRGQVLMPATISITMPEVFSCVKPGERIWFDDGKIGGIIRFVNKGQVHVEITQARYSGSKLKPNKGIRLPDSTLVLPALTKKDLADLEFIAKNADAVCFSFVNDASDVCELQSCLSGLRGDGPGIILKIETVRAFEYLPGILFAAMHSPCVGVMIDRGDLAVECGLERMAEIQEEILRFCEAAHVPVIWATEVLEKLAKKGQPSRAEIIDAAMAVRAECVALNKGPYIVDAVRILDDILEMTRDHPGKKPSMLRELKLARGIGP